MCGRYNLVADAQAFVDAFQIMNEFDWQARYNIAPSQAVPVIRMNAQSRKAALLHWGLIPSWARDRKIAYHTINARAETVDQKPAFRAAFRKRRCLIPATGFYEWRQLGKSKQPYNIRVKEQTLFAFAGLWEHWKSPAGEVLESCTIIVTRASQALAPVHDRMPVILHPSDYASWLDPVNQDLPALKALLQPWPGELIIYPVSRRVGNPANDDPSLIQPLAEGIPDNVEH